MQTSYILSNSGGAESVMTNEFATPKVYAQRV